MRLILPYLPIVAVAAFTFGPHQLSDWMWRPQFIQACVAGAGGRMDDPILRACNTAWDRRVEVASNGWRPTTP